MDNNNTWESKAYYDAEEPAMVEDWIDRKPLLEKKSTVAKKLAAKRATRHSGSRGRQRGRGSRGR